MKRNRSKLKKERRKSSAMYLAGGGNSKYARKVAAGNQMYGPGCCGHDASRQRYRRFLSSSA